MIKLLRLFLAILAGLLIGSAVNMGIILLGGRLIPPPLGADASTMAGLQASLHLFEPRHFVTPFLAHALGTLVGAFTAAWLAPVRPAVAAAVVGGLFLIGGAVNVALLPAPWWFNTVDLLLAYVPMAGCGYALASRVRRDPAPRL